MSLSKYATPGEGKVARKLIDTILENATAVISVDDGGAWPVKQSRDRKLILDSLASSGGDTIVVRGPLVDDAGKRKAIGWFQLIYGNDPTGEELIADYSANDECEAIYRQVEQVWA